MSLSRRTEAQVEQSIFELFQDIPVLCGFTVRSRAGAIELSDIGLFPVPADDEAKLICDEIRQTLAELLEERPEARSLVAGRTFARVVH
jgi:hypothetical protein